MTTTRRSHGRLSCAVLGSTPRRARRLGHDVDQGPDSLGTVYADTRSELNSRGPPSSPRRSPAEVTAFIRRSLGDMANATTRPRPIRIAAFNEDARSARAAMEARRLSYPFDFLSAAEPRLRVGQQRVTVHLVEHGQRLDGSGERHSTRRADPAVPVSGGPR